MPLPACALHQLQGMGPKLAGSCSLHLLFVFPLCSLPNLQAASEYRRYLADWWGDAIKAEFEERKHEAG